MTPFWRGAEGCLQGRPLANEGDNGVRIHLLPGGVGRHGIALERLKQVRLRLALVAQPGWKTWDRVGAFEA